MPATYFRSYPRLVTSLLPLLGGVFCLELAYLCYSAPKADKSAEAAVWVMGAVFVVLACLSWYCFLLTRTISVTADRLVLSYVFLLQSRRIPFSSILRLHQTAKPISAAIGSSTTHLYSDVRTVLEVRGLRPIVLHDVGSREFKELQRCLSEIRRGGAVYKPSRHRLLTYFLDNLAGLWWCGLLSMGVAGLAYGLGLFQKLVG